MLLLLIGTAVVVGGGAYAIARMTRQPEEVRRLLEASVVPIAQAIEATDVKIEGTVEALDETIESPLTATRCVYFEHVVEQVSDAGAPGGGTTAMVGVPIHRAVDGRPFIVRDTSGYAIVDPAGATTLLRIDHRITEEQSAAGVFFRRWMGIAAMGTRHAEQERLLVPGDRVLVIGRAVREPDPDVKTVAGMYRDGAGMRLRFTHSPRFPLQLVDESKG